MDETNITDVKVLKEISDIEETINLHRGDKGKNDGVLFILSVSTLLKELNSTPSRLTNAIINEILPPEFDNPEHLLIPGEYEIPDNQYLVDIMFKQIPLELRDSFVSDTNNDGIYDSSFVIIAPSPETDSGMLTKMIKKGIADTKFCTITSTGGISMAKGMRNRPGEYSNSIGEGGLRLSLIRARPVEDNDNNGRIDQFEARYSLKDVELLDNLDYLQVQINGNPNKPDDHGIANAVSIGIIDIMKAIQMPNITGIEQIGELFENVPILKELFYTLFNNDNFWGILHKPNLDNSVRTDLLNAFYDAITDEIRDLFVSEDFSKAVIFVLISDLEAEGIRKTVEDVNNVLRNYPIGDSCTSLFIISDFDSVENLKIQ
jgi:hypothetical protein